MPSVKGISSLQEQYKLALIKMANGNLAKVVYAWDWKSLDNGSTPLVSTTNFIYMNTVTQEEVNKNMKDVLVRTVEEFGKPTTYVTVRMENGFTLRESTTCVDPSNYSEDIGKEICLKRIEDKIWFLLGYTLQSKLASK